MAKTLEALARFNASQGARIRRVGFFPDHLLARVLTERQMGEILRSVLCKSGTGVARTAQCTARDQCGE
jgi:hypothetical protein